MAKQSKPARSKPRLGRGLSTLVTNSASPRDDDREYQHVTGLPPVANVQGATPAVQTTAGSACEISVDQIAPNPFQPRRDIPSEQLSQLADSIKQQGILQPLIISPSSKNIDLPYLLVAGERRLRAARLLGLSTVPCIVRQASRQQMLEWALVENIQRSDLNPVERAAAYRDYIDRFNLTQGQAAQRLGQPRATVTNYLRILDLCDEIQEMLTAGTLSFGHAKVLAGLTGSPDRQLALARRTVAKGLSVRELERLAAGTPKGTPGQGGVSTTRPLRSKPPYIQDLEERLSRALGTRITILPGRPKNHGRIVVEYYSLDDFDRITAALGLQDSS